MVPPMVAPVELGNLELAPCAELVDHPEEKLIQAHEASLITVAVGPWATTLVPGKSSEAFHGTILLRHPLVPLDLGREDAPQPSPAGERKLSAFLHAGMQPVGAP